MNLERLLHLSWHDRLNAIEAALAQMKTKLYYARVFGSIGKGTRIYKPLLLANARYAVVGDHTLIRPGARIEVLVTDESRSPSLVIGNNVNIEQNFHLICGLGITIGDKVSIAPNCAILDTRHPFREMESDTKIGSRVEPGERPIIIGENTLVGFGSIILPNVRIGSRCVIGANSVVRDDVPDSCVAAGNPARVIMRYDTAGRTWIRTQ